MNKNDLYREIYFSTKNNFMSFIGANNCGCINCLKIFSVKKIKVLKLSSKKMGILCPYCDLPYLVFDNGKYDLSLELLIEVNNVYKEPISKNVYRHSFTLKKRNGKGE